MWLPSILFDSTTNDPEPVPQFFPFFEGRVPANVDLPHSYKEQAISEPLCPDSMRPDPYTCEDNRKQQDRPRSAYAATNVLGAEFHDHLLCLQPNVKIDCYVK